uniref:MATH domain-containing protein n=2 Tax=Caenorhabditis tropicalis TaxID=1561998 RepID=A0A1I7TGQ0_9PELO
MSGATDSDSSTNLRTAEASAEVLQTANDFADICKNISEKQNEQSELNVKVLEKLQAIQNDLNEIKIKLKDDTIFVRDRKTDSIISKSFVMKQIFENVLEVENEKWFNGKLEEHFEVNVEGILLIADMYDTQIAVQKCENFLLKSSKKSSKTKLELAVRYNLVALKDEILSKITTKEDIREVLPSDVEDMDHAIMAELFEKALST